MRLTGLSYDRVGVLPDYTRSTSERLKPTFSWLLPWYEWMAAGVALVAFGMARLHGMPALFGEKPLSVRSTYAWLAVGIVCALVGLVRLIIDLQNPNPNP